MIGIGETVSSFYWGERLRKRSLHSPLSYILLSPTPSPQSAIAGFQSKMASCKAAMEDLKTGLYAKFGDNINLESPEDS